MTNGLNFFGHKTKFPAIRLMMFAMCVIWALFFEGGRVAAALSTIPFILTLIVQRD